MTQTIVYWVEDDGSNQLSEEEWQAIDALQRQTNLREYFHRGRVGLVRFTYTPRWPQLYGDSMLPESMSLDDIERHVESLVTKGWTWEDLVQKKIAARVAGGLYGADCLLAGRSDVSDLRSDLRLVVSFLVKSSMLAPRAVIRVAVEGDLQVPYLTIRAGQISVDWAAVGERLLEHQRNDESDAAADLIEAAEAGDPLAPARRGGAFGA